MSVLLTEWPAFLADAKTAFWLALPVLAKIALVILIAKIGMRLATAFIHKLFLAEHKRMSPQKARTLETLLISSLRYLIYFVAGVTILSTLGVKTESLLASAGIVGLAIGFGAQSLVRDVLTGFFLIFEDQFSVGDYVEIAGFSGFVEEMGLRVTKLRDFSGILHILPNSEITKVSNHSRANRTAMVDVAVPYTASVEEVEAILEKALANAAKRFDSIVEGPRIMGIVNLGQSNTVWRVWARTLPMQHWSTERELRKAIKLALDEAGLQPPYPHTVIHKEGSGD